MHTQDRLSLTLSSAVLVIAAIGCSDADPESAGQNEELVQLAQPGAAVFQFRSKTYNLELPGPCGPDESGGYATWAFTSDANGEVRSDGPQLHALSQGNWSVIDFYTGEGDQVYRVFREAPDQITFTDGVLSFAGTTKSNGGDYVEIEIRCP